MGIVVGASAAGTAAVARSVSDVVLPRVMGHADHKHQLSMQLRTALRSDSTVANRSGGRARCVPAVGKWAS